MKHLLSFLVLIFISCSNETDIIELHESSKIEGVWKLHNIQSATKLTFNGDNWKVESGDVTITGKISVEGNIISGTALTRTGTNSNLPTPDYFSCKFELSEDDTIIEFSEYTGTWIFFQSWYKKQTN